MEKDFHYEGSQSEAGRVQTPNSTSKRVSEGGLDKEIDQLREIRREAHAGAAQRVKELNPDLFGEKRSGRMSHYDIPEQFKDSQHIQQDRQITELRSQLHSIQEAARSTNSQFQDFVKNSNMKFERLAQQMARLEQTHNAFAMESGQKISQLNQKLTERKSLELKVQEMVDRHNNVIKSFEVRMGQLQKLLAEKDAMLVSAQATLNDAKMEITRLKRL